MKHLPFMIIGAVIALAACSPKSGYISGMRALPQEQEPQFAEQKAPGSLTLSDLLIYTRENTPKNFDAKLANDNGLPHTLSLDGNGATTIRTANGKLDVLDKTTLHLRYTPDPDFTGEDSGVIYLNDKAGSQAVATVRIQVENPINTLQPALAVRGTGCIMCHASLKSNVMTDFGYGDSYFFGGPDKGATDHTSIYSDESSDPNWYYVRSLGSKVIVPKASTTDLTKVGTATLAEYLREVLNKNSSPEVRSTDITEVGGMYIGAPTAERILEAAKMTSSPEQVKYIPDFQQAGDIPALIHHTENGTDYYSNDGTLVCSGDLVVDGVVFLNKPVIQTETGCRIYATKSIFMQGGITYKNSNSARQNLQLVSARSINLGLGRNTCNAPQIDKNSLEFRLKEEPRRKFFYTRADVARPVQDNLDRIYDEANQVGMDKLLDAACEPGLARKVSFERLILNSPIVFSRYQGAFKGSIIAEVALMSLNKFIFQFDPIFAKEPVLPLLNPKDYLTVQP